MSNVQSYNALIDRFKAFASGHFILKRFSHGQIEVSDLEKFGEYPFMHVIPSNVTYSQGMKTFSFQIVLADLPRDKEDKTEYQREVLSDLQRIAEDLIAEITNHRVLFGDLITVNNVSLEPFLEEFQHTLTGWTISLDLLVPYYWDACSIPAEWNDMFESSTGGTGSILTFTDSITRDENGFVRLVNDEAEPSPNYYYGTNDEGVRGWYLLTDEVGLTCVTLPSCQTIIDIEAAIDLLQEDMLLKANTADISAVGFSNDYNDLDNKPTIPDVSGFVPYTGATGNVDLGEYELKAGQIELDQSPTGTAGVGVMRWNDTDGTVDIGLKGGNVTLQVGQEEVVRVVNKTGADLLEADYQAVRVRSVSEGGAQGQRLAVVLAQADNDANSATTIGIVTETIDNNQEGFITTNGNVRNINTTGSLQGETWVDGDILYLSGTTAGQLTNVKPAAPTHTIIVGYVVYAHQNNGKIFVKVDNGYELDELHNVSITSPANNEVLTYESSTSLWKNKPVSAGTVTSVAALTLGTTGTDLSSTVANSTSTPVITLNVPTANATNRGVLSASDWSTFNGKQDALGFTPENTANKQNSLEVDGTGTKFPTVDAVNSLSMIDKGKRMVSFFTDFIGTATTFDGLQQSSSGGNLVFGSGAAIPQRTNQIGVMNYTTLTSATGLVYQISGAIQLYLGAGSWVYESSINIANLSTSLERFRTIHGFGSGNSSFNEANGVFITYDEGGTGNGTAASPNWQCVTVANSVRTLTTSSTAVTAAAWHKLRIEINAEGTSVSFYVDDVLLATHTTNIPLGSDNRYILVKQGINKTIGTTARVMYCDYLGYQNTLTTPRA